MSDLRTELLRIARVLTEDDPPEHEYEILVDQWATLCPHPGETDILFWPNELGLCRLEEIGVFRMSPEEMVDYALSWKPRVVAMRVAARTGGSASGFFLYDLEAPGTPRTRVSTSLETAYETGTVVAVALKGVRLPDGTRVDMSYAYNVSSCGVILGSTALPIGADVEGPA